MITTDPVLVGERVSLRPYTAGFTEDELHALFRWGQDREILALSGGSPLEMDFERFKEIFLTQLPRRNSDNEQLFAILDEVGLMVGRVGLFGLGRESASAELGIVIGERSHWNRGYGRDAVRTLTDFGFQSLRLARIYLYTFVENARAQRAFEACGFRGTRQLRRFSFDRGIHTELEMELRAEYR